MAKPMTRPPSSWRLIFNYLKAESNWCPERRRGESASESVSFPTAATLLRWEGGAVVYTAGHAVEQRPHRIIKHRLRKECLNRYHWTTLREARVVIGDFKRDHSHRRRHSALGYLTPGRVCRGVQAYPALIK